MLHEGPSADYAYLNKLRQNKFDGSGRMGGSKRNGKLVSRQRNAKHPKRGDSRCCDNRTMLPLSFVVALRDIPFRVLILPRSADFARRGIQRAEQVIVLNTQKLRGRTGFIDPAIYVNYIYRGVYDGHPTRNEFTSGEITSVQALWRDSQELHRRSKGNWSGDVVSVYLPSPTNKSRQCCAALESSTSPKSALMIRATLLMKSNPSMDRIHLVHLFMTDNFNTRLMMIAVVTWRHPRPEIFICTRHSSNLRGVCIVSSGFSDGYCTPNSVLVPDNRDACLIFLGALEEGCGAFVAVAFVNLGSIRWMVELVRRDWPSRPAISPQAR
ncbi:hypothetical protein BS47DRAFT_1395308 [Hydnum rufescens UP504]|uniref:Uncharacterized protein n=1 Tax=Hydnum rufescens UP504 TaxID=1448309 RepID=A0A9P6DU14_9AGAM|nr:hypothetical protein BS47DRAFT_1395308 [Hydnum rufescens UP504]